MEANLRKYKYTRSSNTRPNTLAQRPTVARGCIPTITLMDSAEIDVEDLKSQIENWKTGLPKNLVV